MSKNSYRSQYTNRTFKHFRLQRGLAFGVIIVAALLAFEAFNFSTTDFALNALLGDLSFFGIAWATILAVAFCGIDFAGIARLFTPEEGANDRNEAWYLFGAWLLAATMNAMLTWWGVSIAIMNSGMVGNAVVERDTLLRIVPIFVAILVWLIRVLIIGTFSIAGDRLFTQSRSRVPQKRVRSGAAPSPQPAHSLGSPSMKPRTSSVPSADAFRPAPKPKTPADSVYQRPEPTYSPLQMKPREAAAMGNPKPAGTPFSSRTTLKS